ncbi:TonB-dependent receptor plug domain-containing protein [Alkalimarinus alittae]|uniref:TonB-dependent receptor n=1 Tax=Alkalimarinus alittae TaxID=2961619 RepID=A0ABY6MYW5_9ALTE|nr:TonB-dependent receptor [Alkalimarinus alittae]UZE95031.1 TonB-dependent receptor [Alkalimarinus alittae]
MKNRYIGAVTCLFSLTVSFAYANDPSNEEDLWSMDIEQLLKVQITSASRFSESTLTTPSSVSVIKREDWEKRAARRTSDAFQSLSGVMILPVPAGGNSIQVRGYGTGTVKGKATLLDDVPINSFIFGSDMFSVDNIELAALDRIELVRGPSSILYGSDAFHSAVSYKTWQPSSGTEQSQFSAGQNDYLHGSVQSSYSLSDEWLLGLSLSASQEGDQDSAFDYQSPIDGSIQSDERQLTWDSQTAILHLIQEAAEEQGFNASLYYSGNDADDFQGGGNASFTSYDRDRGGHDGRLSMARVGYKQPLAYDIGFEAKVYYWKMEHKQEVQIPVLTDTLLDTTEYDENRGGISAILRQDATSIATRWSLEASYEEADVDSSKQKRISLNSGVIVPSRTVDYSGADQSVFGLSFDANTELATQWNAIWGGRYDHYNTFGSEFSPRAGMIFQPVEDIALKLIYSEAFRAPSAIELKGSSFAQGSTELKPEVMQNIELGLVKSADLWELEWTLFHNQWKDRIVLVPFVKSGFTSRYANSGESQSSGSEVTLRNQLNRWLFETSASYVYSENKETNQWNSVFPKLIVNFGVGYSWPAQQVELFVSNRYHDNVYTGDQALPPFSKTDAPAYFRTDLTINKTFKEDWEIGLALRNIFDRDNVLPSLANSYNGVPDIEFDAAMTVRYKH